MSKLNAVKQAFSKKFEMKDMGELSYFLGIKVIQDHKSETTWIGQEACIHRRYPQEIWNGRC